MTSPMLYKTNYDLENCKTGIVHLGYGAFHRAHQSVYIDDYMEKTGDLNWAITAINLRSSDSGTFAKAAGAKSNYVLKEIDTNGTLTYRLVRSHAEYIDATTSRARAIEKICEEQVKVISATVTESGYYFKNDWSLNLSARPIAAGLRGEQVETIYDFLAAALQARSVSDAGPVSVLCCDNIRDNGHVLKNALIEYLAAQRNDRLVSWIYENVTFPCSMVDRITPRTTEALETEMATYFGHNAQSPVHAESFIQWVLEDRFASDFPDLSKVGVEIVADVVPYEETKIRILNGGHTGLAYLGALAGHETFDQAMQDQEIRAHFDAWERDEVLIGLDKNIPFDTVAYLGEISRRFENSGIADSLERICMDGYSKMSIYIRPTLSACLKLGVLPKAGFDCIASWVVYTRCVQEGLCKVPYHEPLWDRVAPLVAEGNETRLANDNELWGDLPKRYNEFVPALVAAIEEMDKKWRA